MPPSTATTGRARAPRPAGTPPRRGRAGRRNAASRPPGSSSTPSRAIHRRPGRAGMSDRRRHRTDGALHERPDCGCDRPRDSSRASARGCCSQHPRLRRRGSPAATHLSADPASPWSWHLPGQVGPDGCPGFKGPFPQPVSMSGAKSRWAPPRSVKARPARLAPGGSNVLACYHVITLEPRREEPPQPLPAPGSRRRARACSRPS